MKDFKKLIEEGLAGLERSVAEINNAIVTLRGAIESWDPRAMRILEVLQDGADEVEAKVLRPGQLRRKKLPPPRRQG